VAINIPGQVVSKPFFHLNGAGAITSKQAVIVGASATNPQVCNQVLPNLFNFLSPPPGYHSKIFSLRTLSSCILIEK
jgi:hypothetical protein